MGDYVGDYVRGLLQGTLVLQGTLGVKIMAHMNFYELGSL